MKISKQASGTKNSMRPVSGSTSTPMVNGWVPRAAEPNGSHGTAFWITAANAPKLVIVSVLKKTTQLITQDTAIKPMATVWLTTLLRFVKRTINANESSGGMGISQVSCCASKGVRNMSAPELPLHEIHVFRNHRV